METVVTTTAATSRGCLPPCCRILTFTQRAPVRCKPRAKPPTLDGWRVGAGYLPLPESPPQPPLLPQRASPLPTTAPRAVRAGAYALVRSARCTLRAQGFPYVTRRPLRRGSSSLSPQHTSAEIPALLHGSVHIHVSRPSPCRYLTSVDDRATCALGVCARGFTVCSTDSW